MTDKPKMYQNRLNKEFHNNKSIFMSNTKNNKSNEEDIRNKINKLTNSNNFIYSTKVNIVLENETIERKIIGIYGNNILTIDNEYIPIDSIIDIYK